MRLTTWNCCRSSVSKSLEALARLNPTIVLLQECADPGTPVAGGGWRHTAKQLGVATVGMGARPTFPSENQDLPPSAVAAIVDGPTSFALVNVWAQLPRYEDDVLTRIRSAKRVLPADLPVVVAGDFNSARRRQATPTQR